MECDVCVLSGSAHPLNHHFQDKGNDGVSSTSNCMQVSHLPTAPETSRMYGLDYVHTEIICTGGRTY